MNKIALDIQWPIKMKKELKEKYSIDKSVFLINGKTIENKDFSKWFSCSGKPLESWMKYKRLGKNEIELKMFSPNPSDGVCNKIIDNFVEKISDRNDSYFTLKYCEESKIISFYSLKEVKKDLFYLLKNGYFKINLLDEGIKNNKKVYHLGCSEGDSVKKMLDAGYIELEFS